MGYCAGSLGGSLLIRMLRLLGGAGSGWFSGCIVGWVGRIGRVVVGVV